MTGKVVERASTLVEAVKASLEGCARHAPGEIAPAAILWPDADGQWLPLVEHLRNLMPELLVLGAHEPRMRQGPAIWLRCVIERALPEVSLPEGTTPVLYLPNVSRQTLRAVEECPDALKPLVELQYRGAIWCQRSGKDWTVEAFLVSDDGGMGLDVAKDNQTRRALLGALARVATTPLARLRDKRLEAEDFDKLMVEDTPRNLLEWMNDSRAMREKWDKDRWSAFRARCKAEYDFDPQADGELTAGERLGRRQGLWKGLWERFTEAPALYPGLGDLLRKARPSAVFDMCFVRETWPDENDKAEADLRKALARLGDGGAAEAREQIAKLEAEHGVRRGWVWAKLGQSPLAKALEHLARLAQHTAVGLGGDSPAAMAELYARGGYLADDAALRAMAEVKSAEDCNAVFAAAHSMYLPWLREAAEHFQKLVAATGLPSRGDEALVKAQPGTCILFVDGLRFDLAQRLAGLAQERRLRVAQDRRWAATPTVTGTCKPAVSPVADRIAGHKLGDDFLPDVADTGQPATRDRFRKLLVAAGYQVLPAAEIGQPLAPEARAWTEYGEFDELGHKLQAKLVAHIDAQLGVLADRIGGLLEAGWRQVRVVTDHGWLLVPRELPAVSLPKYLTESRWARCATVKSGTHISTPTSGWYWNPAEVFAFGAGVSCFGGGVQYSHGGLSIQECLVADMAFTADADESVVQVRIAEVQWLGMRCRVTVEPAGAPVIADIRTKVGDEKTSVVATSKPVDAEGKAGLVVSDDSLEGTAASVVLVDSSGRVVAKKATTVGGEE